MSEQILANIIPAVFAIITTIVGGIFGFALSEFSARRREGREAKQRSESVRLILGLEIDRNLEALRAFWTEVKQHDYETPDQDRRKRDVGHKFLEIPLLSFSRDSLNSQLPLMAFALPKDMISAVFQLYDRLGKLETLRRELGEALRDQQEEMARFRASQAVPTALGTLLYAPRTPFDKKAAQVWDEVEALIKSTLDNGNPIKGI